MVSAFREQLLFRCLDARHDLRPLDHATPERPPGLGDGHDDAGRLAIIGARVDDLVVIAGHPFTRLTQALELALGGDAIGEIGQQSDALGALHDLVGRQLIEPTADPPHLIEQRQEPACEIDPLELQLLALHDEIQGIEPGHRFYAATGPLILSCVSHHSSSW
ncbi:MAG TPA: hypothetical protein VGD80_03950 [Kofleriaceae bacterium]